MTTYSPVGPHCNQQGFIPRLQAKTCDLDKNCALFLPRETPPSLFFIQVHNLVLFSPFSHIPGSSASRINELSIKWVIVGIQWFSYVKVPYLLLNKCWSISLSFPTYLNYLPISLVVIQWGIDRWIDRYIHIQIFRDHWTAIYICLTACMNIK